MKSFKFAVAAIVLGLLGFVASVRTEDPARSVENKVESTPAKVEVDLLVERLKSSTDDLQTYKMLASLAVLLDCSDKIISLEEELLRLVNTQLAQVPKEIDQYEKEIGEAKAKGVFTDREVEVFRVGRRRQVNFVGLAEHRQRLEAMLKENKVKYSLHAVAYNEKMIETGFRFTDASTLPAGKTVVLPKQFAIR